MEMILGWAGFALGAGFSFLDAVLTGMVLAKGGREKNFVLRWLMNKVGIIPGLGIPKLLSAAFCAWAISQGVWVVGPAMLVAFGYICKRNYEVLRIL